MGHLQMHNLGEGEYAVILIILIIIIMQHLLPLSDLQ
jgi:hypothetical protein